MTRETESPPVEMRTVEIRTGSLVDWFGTLPYDERSALLNALNQRHQLELNKLRKPVAADPGPSKLGKPDGWLVMHGDPNDKPPPTCWLCGKTQADHSQGHEFMRTAPRTLAPVQELLKPHPHVGRSIQAYRDKLERDHAAKKLEDNQ